VRSARAFDGQDHGHLGAATHGASERVPNEKIILKKNSHEENEREKFGGRKNGDSTRRSGGGIRAHFCSFPPSSVTLLH